MVHVAPAWSGPAGRPATRVVTPSARWASKECQRVPPALRFRNDAGAICQHDPWTRGARHTGLGVRHCRSTSSPVPTPSQDVDQPQPVGLGQTKAVLRSRDSVHRRSCRQNVGQRSPADPVDWLRSARREQSAGAQVDAQQPAGAGGVARVLPWRQRSPLTQAMRPVRRDPLQHESHMPAAALSAAPETSNSAWSLGNDAGEDGEACDARSEPRTSFEVR